MAYYRICQSNGDGTVSQLPFVQDENGNTHPRPVTSQRRLTVAQARQLGLPIWANAATPVGGNGSTIKADENQIGRTNVYRSEYQDGPVSAPKTVSVSYANASGSTIYPVIGDGATIIFASGRYAALPGAGVTIGGTYGRESHAMLKQISATMPFKVVQCRLDFTAGFLTVGSMVSAFGDIDGNVNTQPLAINTWLEPDDFQTTLVNSPAGFRLILGPQTALIPTIPTAYTLTLTFTFVSVANVYGMNLVGPNPNQGAAGQDGY